MAQLTLVARGGRHQKLTLVPNSPDCDLCMQQLCTCAAGGAGGGMQGGERVCPGPGLPSFHHQLPTSPLPLNAPCSSCSNFGFCCSTCAPALSNHLKNQINHSLHELGKKPGAQKADAIRFDIEPHTDVNNYTAYNCSKGLLTLFGFMMI